jgi:WS/DGAT/MGAT family acyltransferase
MSASLSALDALFLHAEDGTSHMHIGSCAIFAGPAPTMPALSGLLRSKLHLLGHYRQKIRFVPMHLGHPVWVDDGAFDLAHHLRHITLRGPGGDAELEELIGRLMSEELDRERPLWAAWLVDGLSGGRWALVSKVHHCMVDGVAGTDLLMSLLDADRNAPVAAPPAWSPRPAPSDARLAIEAMATTTMRTGRRLVSLGRIGFDPVHLRSRLGEIASGAQSLGRELMRTSHGGSIKGTIGPERRWAVGRCRLDVVKEISRAVGGSVNDVILASITGAFRELLLSRGELGVGEIVRTLVPVSVRGADDHSPNNQVSLFVAELPVGLADPCERLEAVCDEMTSLKGSHQAVAAGAILGAFELLPPPAFAFGTRALMRLMRRVPQSLVHTVTTNVPGPQRPFYLLGREMVEYLPFVPLSEGVRIGVAIVSYNGHVAFGVTGDYDTAPEVHDVAKRIEAEVALLARSAPRLRRRQKAMHA